MGYYIDMELVDVIIREDKVKQALKAINDMNNNKKEEGGKKEFYEGNVYHLGFSWVNYPESGEFTDIREAFKEWRYASFIEESGDLVLEEFTGNKLGDDEYFWETLAPFIEDGGEVIFTGEEKEQWKYVFNDGKSKRFSAELTWMEH